MSIPKYEKENLQWREDLLRKAEKDKGLQIDLLAACKESLLFWINTFVMTYHQFDVDPETGMRIEAVNANVPFVTWQIQDELFNTFRSCLKDGKDILIDKSRDMGASWCCIVFIHWIWLFSSEKNMLELSRTESYVDQTGNMKALFQKHDYINKWLPAWMVPPQCNMGEKHRTKMHMKNILNNSTIDGESTTQHAASGARLYIALLDEFSKVEHGALMRSATRDAAYIRIVNSTPAGAGTEYSRWKYDGTIKVFKLPFWEHPKKGKGRYVKATETGGWEIRSPWFNNEEKVRSPKELAREVLMQDIESGDMFFTIPSIDKHIALFAKKPKTYWDIALKENVHRNDIKDIIRARSLNAVRARQTTKGKLKVWTNLIAGRPDQSKTYIFGIDVSKGQGASNSVVSIKCKESNVKIAEWVDANTPPYNMVPLVIALAIWFGGAQPHKLPFLIWEKNGPGWDFGKLMVKEYHYPYYYRGITPGKITDKKSDKYGFQTDRQSKFELLSLYDRILTCGGYINPSQEALEEAKYYIYYKDGGIGPASLIEESSSAKKTHGDRVIADALTLDPKDTLRKQLPEQKIPKNSYGYRLQQIEKKKQLAKSNPWRMPFDFSKGKF